MSALFPDGFSKAREGARGWNQGSRFQGPRGLHLAATFPLKFQEKPTTAHGKDRRRKQTSPGKAGRRKMGLKHSALQFLVLEDAFQPMGGGGVFCPSPEPQLPSRGSLQGQ